jgi:serine/threonine protein kinase
MGAVHCARDRLTGQQVALKRVRLRAATAGVETTIDELASTPQPAALGAHSGTLMAIGTSADNSGERPGRPAAAPRSATGSSLPGTDEQVATMQLALAREFHMLASLRHPNIISVLDYGFDVARQPYFTMDLLPAAQTILAVAAEVQPAARVDLIVQVLQALSYLHRRGVVHRDLKPSSRRAGGSAAPGLPQPGDGRRSAGAAVSGLVRYRESVRKR